MIGKVTFPDNGQGRPAIVTLNDDRTLAYDDERIRPLIDTQFLIYQHEYSVGSGPFGVGFLNHVAKKHGGKAEITPQEDEGEEVIH